MALATLALLALPASASAWSIHGFRVTDAGPELVTRLTVCDPSPRVHRITFRYRFQTDDGADVLTDWSAGVQDVPCITWTHRVADTLRYEGEYFARIRVRLGRFSRYTAWRSFWSS